MYCHVKIPPRSCAIVYFHIHIRRQRQNKHTHTHTHTHTHMQNTCTRARKHSRAFIGSSSSFCWRHPLLIVYWHSFTVEYLELSCVLFTATQTQTHRHTHLYTYIDIQILKCAHTPIRIHTYLCIYKCICTNRLIYVCM